MNTLELFTFKTNRVRVVPDFKDGQPYFVAKDVAEALEFRNPKDAVVRLCPNRLILKASQVKVRESNAFDIPNRGLSVIPEGDVYQMVMRSNLPSALTFRDWVCNVVLPSLRKTGAYVVGEEKVTQGEISEDEMILKVYKILMDKVENLKRTKHEQAQLIEAQAKEIQTLKEDANIMTIRQWEVDVLRGYLLQPEKNRLAAALKRDRKTVDSVPTMVNGHPSKVNRYNRDDITEAAMALGFMGGIE